MIAIDPSLNSTGLAWFNLAGSIETEAIKIKNLRGPARLAYVRDVVASHIVGHSVVVYEDYSLGSKGSAVFNIAEMGGVLKTLCYEKGLQVLLVPPSVLKLFATGAGNAKKEHMAAAIQKKWGLVFTNDDEADAFALLKLGEAYYSKRVRRCYPQKVQESLSRCGVVNGRIRK